MSRTGKHYNKDFINQIVSLFRSGKEVSELSSEYGVSRTSIERWVKNESPIALTKEGEEISIEKYNKLLKDNARLKLENEILKKATAIFAKS